MSDQIMPYHVVKFIGEELDWMKTKITFQDSDEELMFEESWGILFNECKYEGVCVWFKEINIDDSNDNISYTYETFEISPNFDYGEQETFDNELSKVLVNVFKQGIKEYVESATEVRVN